MLKGFSRTLIGAAALFSATPATAAQTAIDRADPSVVEEELRKPERETPAARPPLVIQRRAPETAVSGGVLIGAIRIDGAVILPPEAFAPVIETYVGRRLSPADLAALATDTANVARELGYGLATAYIPKQQISNGLLRVVIDEGRVDDVMVEGTAEAPVRRVLAPIANGRPLLTSTLERQLLIAGDLPGVSLGRARLDRSGGRSVLRLRADQKRIEGRVSADNWGSGTIGPVRAHLAIDINGLLANDDQLTIGGTVTPLQPKEYALAHFAYSKAIGANGTTLNVGGYVARSQPGGELADLDIEGRSIEGSVGINHPLLRTRAASVWGDLEFAVRDVKQDREGARVREDRLAILTASAFASAKIGDARGRLRLSLRQGLNVFGATGEGDPLSSRADGSGVFTKLEYWAQYDQPLLGAFSLQLQSEGQIATRALLSSEEMGLGGRYFLRGYDYREYSGDLGIAGSFEFRYDLSSLPEALELVQFYAFADVGTVGNYDDGVGSGSLASAGGGVRIRLDGFHAGFEVGVPLTDRPDLEDDTDPRLSFTLGKRF